MTFLNRKIFNLDNLNESKTVANLSDKQQTYENSISAGGCLFYKRNEKNEIKLLLIKYDDPAWTKLDDFGGRVDVDDETITDTIIRETCEETNNILTFGFMEALFEINENIKTFYTKQSKYYLKLVEVNDLFYENTDVFGNFEATDKIKRIIKWFDYMDNKKILAQRIINNIELVKYLDSLLI